MNCHICGQPSIGQCQACWKFYCAEHGDRLCQECKENAPGWLGSGLRSIGTGGFTDAPGHPAHPPSDMEALLEEAGIPRRRILLRVVPAVQTQTIGDTQVRLVSLELYDDGFLAHVGLKDLGERQLSNNPFLAMPGLPQIVFEASDDTGQAYASHQGAGGGGDSEYRFEIIFSPAVPDGARTLTLTAVEVQWLSVAPGQRSRVEPGPWRFEIPLA